MDKQEKKIQRSQYFSSMSNEKLQHLLQLDFQSSKSILTSEDTAIISDILSNRLDKNLKNDTFDIEEGWKSFQTDYLPMIDAEILDVLEDTEDSEFDLENGLEDLQRNDLPLFDLQDCEKTTFQQYIHKKSIWNKKQWCSVAVVCLVFFVTFSVTATASGVFSKIAQWTDDIFHFDRFNEFQLSSNQSPCDGNINLKEIFQTTQELPDVIPSWLPDGMIKTQNKYAENENQKQLIILYENPKIGTYIQLDIKYSNAASETLYEKDNSPMMIYQKDNIDYYFMKNLELETVVWCNGPLECQISGTISREELKKMIDSISS